MTPSDIQLNRLLYYLQRAPRIGILSHKNVDGDSLGAQLALAHGFRARGTSVYCGNLGTIPKKLQFLPGAEMVEELSTREDAEKFFACCDLLLAVDTGDYGMTGLSEIGVEPEHIPVPFVNIDHHADNPGYGLINVVIHDASSTAEIVANIFDGLGISLTTEISTCLLLGIFNDTDSFKNANVYPSTLELTSRLIAAGANMHNIAMNFLRDKTVGTMRLWGEVLSRVHENAELGVVSTVVTLEDIEQYEATPEDLEGIVNFLNSIPDARAALLLSEREKGMIKGSLRTLHDDVDVSKIARLLGGGGHKKAAGFAIPGRLVQDGEKWYIQDDVALAAA